MKVAARYFSLMIVSKEKTFSSGQRYLPSGFQAAIAYFDFVDDELVRKYYLKLRYSVSYLDYSIYF